MFILRRVLSPRHRICFARDRRMACPDRPVLNLRSPGWAVLLAAVWLMGTAVQAADPVLVDAYTDANLFYGVDLDGPTEICGVSYGVGNDNGAVRLFSGGDPLSPITSVPLSGGRKVRIASGRIHVLYAYSSSGTWRSGLRLYDSTSLAPRSGTLYWTGRSSGLDVDGDTAYVTVEDQGLFLFDVSDPDDPSFVASAPGVGVGNDVCVSGGLALVADGADGLKVFDVTDPTSPQLRSSWVEPSRRSLRGVTMDRGAGIACAVGEGFWLLDLSMVSPGSTNAPVPLAALDEDAYRVRIADNSAYVAGEYGLRVYDVSDRSAPQIEGRHVTPFRSEDVRILPPLVYLADRSGLIVLRHGTPPPPALEVGLLKLARDGVTDPYDLTGQVLLPTSPLPLEPVADEAVLRHQPSVTEGLVADGVTPLIVQITGRDLTGLLAVRWRCEITGGGTVDGGTNLTGRLRCLQGGEWKAGVDSTTLLSPDDDVFLWLEALEPWDLELADGAVEIEAQIRLENPDDGSPLDAGSPRRFRLRRPPLLVASTDDERWRTNLADADRPEDFIRTFPGSRETSEQAAGSWMEEWSDDWAFNRVDVLAHGRGVLRVRPHCLAGRFRHESNLHRGWFRRIVCVGATHNGTRIWPYIEALNGQLSPLGQANLGIACLLRFGRELDPDHAVYRFELAEPHDPAASFHHLTTQIDPNNAAFRYLGLTGSRLSTVFPHGSDGLVDWDSAVIRAGDPNHSEVPGEIAHTRWTIVAALERGQAESPEVIQRVRELLDQPAAGVFAPLEPRRPPHFSETAMIIEAARDAAVPVLVEIALNKALTRSRRGPGETQQLSIVPHAEHPLTGNVNWAVAVHGTGAQEVSLTPGPDPATSATVTIGPGVLGDVLVSASYPTASNRLVFARFATVASREPEGAVLTGLAIEPTDATLALDSEVEPRFFAVYDDGTRLERWFAPDELALSTDAPEVVAITADRGWSAEGIGTATLHAEWRGFSAQAMVAVVDPHPSRSFAAWCSDLFTVEDLATPSISGPAADLDLDGVNTFMEYVLGGSPFLRDAWIRPCMVWHETPSGPRPALRIQMSSALTGVSVDVETSSDLESWDPWFDCTGADAWTSPQVLSLQLYGAYRVATLAIEPGPETRFYRVAAQEEP